ncbi:uncharacterized protein EDB93DRAFT_1253841 [Suillus bovinus]|uniref:uncharacterized protein n=1 Tax=Suillus bovinus TaxID=48563 RepID=UPI001B85F1B9|nr:uncharacterized protein EDB93DRAFT_1253841 [Suillus bovinus]KAG2136985.1 hypothetical protein EDB93DRAFT_1253841 [Suillus bovinus]
MGPPLKIEVNLLWAHGGGSGLAKFKVFVESEDEEDSVTQPISRGVPEVVLPWLSPDVARMSGSPRSPQSPKKKPFGPATAIASKRPEVIEPPQATPEPLVEVHPSHRRRTTLARLATRWNGPAQLGLTRGPAPLCMSCVYCTTKKIKCISVNPSPGPPGGPDPGPLPKLPPKLRPPCNPPAHQSQVSSVTPGPSRAQTPKVQTRGRSKTVTAAKEPTPAPALPSSTSGVPHSALDVPMLDLHAMAMADSGGLTPCNAFMKAFNAKSSSSTQHFHFRMPKVMQHHFCFINLSLRPCQPLHPHFLLSLTCLWKGWSPTPPPPNLQDESAIDGLIFELNQIHPEVSQMPSEIVKPDDPGNLFPEYDSVEEMDVQVKGEPSGEDVDMTT